MGTTNLSINPGFTGGGIEFSAEDTRHITLDSFGDEGVIQPANGGFAITQRGAGANMSVDVAAGSAVVQGDSSAIQGKYFAREVATVNVTVSAADGSNPRIDRVVIEIKDNDYDSSGLRVARIRTIEGTPTSGANAATNTNGIAALPSSCLEIARFTVGAGATTITNANIVDFRLSAGSAVSDDAADATGINQDGVIRRGKSIVSTEEVITSVSFALAPTPDRVQSVVLPTDGLIRIGYNAMWKSSVNNTAQAAIFIGSNQLKVAQINGTTPFAQGASLNINSANHYNVLVTNPGGLQGISSGLGASDYAGPVTTGQAIGTLDQPGTTYIGGFVEVFAAAGTYDISVQFKSSSGTVTVKERRLWVEAIGF